MFISAAEGTFKNRFIRLIEYGLHGSDGVSQVARYETKMLTEMGLDTNSPLPAPCVANSIPQVRKPRNAFLRNSYLLEFVVLRAMVPEGPFL